MAQKRPSYVSHRMVRIIVFYNVQSCSIFRQRQEDTAVIAFLHRCRPHLYSRPSFPTRYLSLFGRWCQITIHKATPMSQGVPNSTEYFGIIPFDIQSIIKYYFTVGSDIQSQSTIGQFVQFNAKAPRSYLSIVDVTACFVVILNLIHSLTPCVKLFRHFCCCSQITYK